MNAAISGNTPPRVILFEGFGLGYHIEHGLEIAPETHCIVFETDPGLIKAAFHCRDFGTLLARERLSLIVDTSGHALSQLLRSIRRHELAIIRLRAVYTRHRTYYEAVDRAVENLLRRQEINHNTLVRFGRRWIRNLADNLKTIASALPVSRLENRFRDMPALLLAGGPSLDEVIPMLPQIAERAVIIAVDTSLQACLRAGVEPDYAVIVDPQYWNTRHLDAARAAKCEIISESSTHPRVFRLLDGPVSMCSSLFPLGSYIEDSEEPFGRLGAGGSVSTTAWDFARHIGCSPVFCAGLDLGFPGRATHFRGSFFEARALTIGRRLFPVETMAFDYLHGGKTEYVEANNGQHVLSDRRMNIYIWWFETQMNRYPQTRTLNLSSRGVAIPGMPGATVHELLNLPVRRNEIDSVRADAAPRPETDGVSRRKRGNLLESIASLNAHLHELEQVAASAASVAADAKAAHAHNGEIPGDLLEQLDRADESIRANRYRDIAGFLIQEITERIRTGSHENALEASHALYSGLVESCRYHRAVLERGALKLTSNPTDNKEK